MSVGLARVLLKQVSNHSAVVVEYTLKLMVYQIKHRLSPPNCERNNWYRFTILSNGELKELVSVKNDKLAIFVSIC